MHFRKAGGCRLGRNLVRLGWRILPRRLRSYQRLEPDSLSPPAAPVLPRWARYLRHRVRSSMVLGGGDWKQRGGEKEAPPPKGHLVVYVGCDGGGVGEKEAAPPPQRYLVPVIYFNHPLFGELLREAEEEFGFHHQGGITIPCPASRFERVQSRIAASAAAAARRRSLWAS